MDVTVQTGMTKSTKGVSLVALSFVSSQKEQVCLLLETEADASEAKTVEKECVAVVEHALLETDGGAAERLDGTLKELNGLLKGLILSKAIDGIHAIVAIVDRDLTLHVSHAGSAEAYIIRAGAASQITEYTRGKPVPAFVHIASGRVEARDTVVFSTQRLLRAVTPAQLAQHAQHGDQLLDELVNTLESEREHAALAVMHASGGQMKIGETSGRSVARALPARRDRRGRSWGAMAAVAKIGERGKEFLSLDIFRRGWEKLSGWTAGFLVDLKHPQRKRRAHLLIVAGALAIFIVLWVIVNLSASTERGKTKAELTQLMEQIDQEIRTSENRQLSGDIDGANLVLDRAQEEAEQIMNNESGLYRREALDLLDRIRTKKEEINHIVRLSPRLVVNATAKSASITLIGMVGLTDGEFVLYDQQNHYRALLNAIDDPQKISAQETITDAAGFARYQTVIFQTAANSIIETIGGQPTTMKTEDPAGWISGTDIKTYLRFLYLLSPENNQIYKYERLSNRYGAPTEYNVNGKLEGAIDMAVDGAIFILKRGGEVVKLFRGEVQPFAIRHAPEEKILATATKVFKVPGGNLYFLDPTGARVIVATDGGTMGESSYKMQYVLEGDQIGTLKDLFVDADEAHLYVLDEKRLHVVDLAK
ncbi:MAG TPA: hypothetical protein DEB30_01770 [Candidatus Peribacter riflensis]|uniref:PPM-type phosphatase domain-containing protein n=1 Tax=Candidatus Peribacter riflensis TaxID=1735162 RepID=A0A0S1SWC1_9BACT|nr:MAG: hypothetical protein PeribacterA2_1025 [Candidatus Peribacter riflensis]OGJ82844.1 MAG: hypothetical protein A2412_01690 [Candidatus Peribacteria bacterium RIFOXYC1_FULL_58_8]ALM11486.1 MAG: hypothetical protein PeribacterB2_1027 [Candidatus Peribacter riflensis]ALM12588.1 MAG: hypothetical protein PeribacterC2_1026 [Candidatus Peribacter riflensis]ALM13689.1 MAG: hypothetical protein PeribacterD1_1025 [Candidatus Peribacter riflensis]